MGYMTRETLHMFWGALLAIVFAVLLNVDATLIPLFIVAALIGSRFPGFDRRMGLGHRSPITHSFLIPLLIAVTLPPNIFVTAFFVGYTSHMLLDLQNKEQTWMWIQKRTGRVLLKLSAAVTIVLIFGWNLEMFLRIVGS
jgi:hypothetical protein